MPCDNPEAEIERLRARVDALERALGLTAQFPPEWGLTTSEKRILGVLATRPAVPRMALYEALYGDRVNPPDDTTVTTLVCKLRRKMAAVGFTIGKTRNYGNYSIPDEERRRILAHLRRDDDGLRIST